MVSIYYCRPPGAFGPHEHVFQDPSEQHKAYRATAIQAKCHLPIACDAETESIMQEVQGGIEWHACLICLLTSRKIPLMVVDGKLPCFCIGYTSFHQKTGRYFKKCYSCLFERKKIHRGIQIQI